MDVQNIELIIEKGETGIWGRVNYNDNLIVDEAGNLNELELNLKGLLKEFEDIDPENVIFDVRNDVDPE